MRVAATRALLRRYDEVFFDRWMYALLDVDRHLAASVRPQLEEAVQRAVTASRNPQKFDMPTQAALLLGPLAALDHARAASLASQLVMLAPDWPRTLREVALGLGCGSGPATLYHLQRLTESTHESVAAEARLWLKRREEASG